MISIRNIYKYYGRKRAVGPIDATIERGEIVGLLGLNGAGKSTTIRMLACELLPSSGTIEVDGVNVVDNPNEVRKRVGYLPDTPPLYPDMRVGEYLGFVARLRGIPRTELDSRIEKAERRAGIEKVHDALIQTLSHGYRQRVGIAQAIVHDPPFILLDEPIAGLDPEQIVSMRQLIKSLGGEHTVLISSHILSEVSETCDRLLVIRDGTIVASGTESELFATLGESQHVHLQVEPSERDSEKLLDTLRRFDGVLEVTEDAQSQPGLLDLHVMTKGDLRSRLARMLVEEGHGLVTLARAERELENVFLKIAAQEPSGTPHQKMQESSGSEDVTTNEEKPS